jgi:hypothetical protein
MEPNFTIPPTANFIPLDTSAQYFGSLKSSNDILENFSELRRRIKEEGYLYLPDFFPKKKSWR